MADHEHSYKLLFSHAALVRDLLQGFVQEAWVADLDLSTLENTIGGCPRIESLLRKSGLWSIFPLIFIK